MQMIFKLSAQIPHLICHILHAILKNMELVLPSFQINAFVHKSHVSLFAQ